MTDALYNADYYKTGCGRDYSDSKFWSPVFERIADSIIEDFAPKTVLDAGCAYGYLVAALRDRGVQAFGIDISKHAIANVRNNIKPYCSVCSLTDPLPENFPNKFDLITCIEVLEHMNEDEGTLAIENLCKHTENIIFSSTPSDLKEPTHFNVQQQEYWAKRFAVNGFFNQILYSANYISSFAVFYKKSSDISKVVEEYEQNIRMKNMFTNEEIKKTNKTNFIYKCNYNTLKKQYCNLNKRYIKVYNEYNNVIMSNSWRITKPIRYILDKYKLFKKNINNINKSNKSKEVQVKNNSINNNKLSVFKLKKFEFVVILTTKHCNYLADIIDFNLKKIGVVSRVIFETPENGYDPVPHFVICPQMFKELPELYVAFQMEQSVSPRWFTPHYLQILKSSAAILDYSLVNLGYLQKNGIDLNELYYLPISVMEINRPKCDQWEYDVLFYGDDNCDRRKAMLERLGKYNIKIINDLFGEDLIREIDKARIIVNIHYYEGALLETTRLSECLTRNNSVLISEKSVDYNENTKFEQFVDFVEIGDIESIEKLIDYYLDKPERISEKLIRNYENFDKEDFCPFEFFFFRFLLASENVTYEEFYNITGHKYRVNEDKLALGLPEDRERYKGFCDDNKYGFRYFYGLRHMIGWIGCGLSYKFMLQQAKQSGIKHITICEDDVYFKPDFVDRYAKIFKYLNNNMDKWDVFSGLNADVADDVRILDIEFSDEEGFIFIDKMVSTVFNIYNSSFMELICDWDEQNHDPMTNTIDRFIENKLDIKVLITVPYLVGHKEFLDSTLWGHSNKAYIDMIESSENRLMLKALDFLNNH